MSDFVSAIVFVSRHVVCKVQGASALNICKVLLFRSVVEQNDSETEKHYNKNDIKTKNYHHCKENNLNIS